MELLYEFGVKSRYKNEKNVTLEASRISRRDRVGLPNCLDLHIRMHYYCACDNAVPCVLVSC